jgi:hypothetical protein
MLRLVGKAKTKLTQAKKLPTTIAKHILNQKKTGGLTELFGGINNV